MRSIAGRLRFQPSRSAPSLPHQAPAERGENTGIPKASKPRKSLRLDPLENSIRRLQPLSDRAETGAFEFEPGRSDPQRSDLRTDRGVASNAR
jgi:hypothetical protein